ncbi:MAG: UvrD-helicase domain-containing protein [Candidatus Dojkabacteria bacterium]|nr:UvrD-helicase domain-containing protein [Candidatus Dojkabacteria bacterium]
MIFNNLNPPQKEAVSTVKGPLLILAGAGSGKTRVLTHRIAYILQQKLCCPEEILAVTFTNKAAGEMKERVEKLVGSQQSSISRIHSSLLPFIGTFHSVCVKILRRDGHHIGIDPNFSIYDTDDQLSAVKQAMKELRLSTKELNPNSILGFISSSKNELITPRDYKNYSKGYIQDAVNSIYPLYQRILRENNALDFDDLIGRTVELFQNSGTTLTKYQEQFKFVLVDEYQDTNHAQYAFVNKISKKQRNICVVGDDDQAIYSWRGATIKNILSFEEDYPETKVIKLEQNYRSTKNILDAAYNVIQHNKERKAKRLWTEKKDGPKIEIYQALDEKDEARFIVEKILEEKDYLNNAVLYRTNAQSRTLEEAFLNYGVPYQIFGSISFYQRKEIKDVLAYLRCIYNPKDDVSLKRIINTPPRKIGAITISNLQSLARRNNTSIATLLFKTEGNDINGSVNTFCIILKKIRKASEQMKLTDFINFVLNVSGYIDWLSDGTPENDSRIENIKELMTVAVKYDEMDPESALTAFLEEVSLIEEQQLKAQTQKDKNRVTLMTMHSAKGLEFENVFIAGMEEGLFPHSRSYTDPTEMEEERRLAYVGITRAKEHLYLTHAESRKVFGSAQDNLASRFISNIPDELIISTSWDSSEEDASNNYSQVNRLDRLDQIDPAFDQIDFIVGDRVEHAEFGKGRVMEINDNIVKVDFGPLVGVKQLAVEYANLKRVEVEEF